MSADLKALSEAATPGEWKLIWHGNESYPYPLSITGDDGQFWIARDGTTSKEANARLIVALVNAYRSGSLIPASTVEDLKAALAEAREALAPFARLTVDGKKPDEFAAEYPLLAKGLNAASATLSRIDALLAAEPEARG